MSDFNPGPGWRDATSSELPSGVPQIVEYNADGIVVRCWLHEAPVPPLPTAPYTVIRVTWRSTGGVEVLILNERMKWRTLDGIHAQAIEEDATSFEVLSEPRATTAKAVLDRIVTGGITTGDDVELRAIGREFRVI
jgi:hypothetical protein